jgi:hypothetical protein
MTTPAHAPDPMDGLRLAQMQHRRERLLARVAGRTFGLMEGLMAMMLVGGIAVAINGDLGSYARMLRLGLGLLLIFEAVFLWWYGRRSAREQLRRLEQQIEAETRRPDAAVIATAATAARGYLLNQRR